MKWDIDKALNGLEGGSPRDVPGTSIERVWFNPEDRVTLDRMGLKLTPARKAQAGQLVSGWVIGFGKAQHRKTFFYGWTIHEAYLTARRAMKAMHPADLEWFGLQVPKKRSNSYASARRKAKPRKKSS